MGVYEVVHSVPVLGIENGFVVLAATVLGRFTAASGKAFVHVRVWTAGEGERDLDLTPAEFSEWRRSFVRPESAN